MSVIRCSYVFTLISLWLGLFLTQSMEGKTKEEQTHEPRFEVGVGMHSMFPNRLPEFESHVLGYGLWLGAPIGDHAIQLQGMFGSNDLVQVYLADLSFRFNIRTPFFVAVAMAGVHVLHYHPFAEGSTYVGPNVGVGFTLEIASSLAAHSIMKLYQQQRVLITFGVNLVYLI